VIFCAGPHLRDLGVEVQIPEEALMEQTTQTPEVLIELPLLPLRDVVV